MFVERSQALGASTFWIMRKQILPNVLPLIFANTVLIIALAILSEVDAVVPRPRRHHAIPRGARCSTPRTSRAPCRPGAWWYFIPPGLCICLLVMGFTLVGYAIEEIINPRLRERR